MTLHNQNQHSSKSCALYKWFIYLELSAHSNNHSLCKSLISKFKLNKIFELSTHNKHNSSLHQHSLNNNIWSCQFIVNITPHRPSILLLPICRYQHYGWQTGIVCDSAGTEISLSYATQCLPVCRRPFLHANTIVQRLYRNGHHSVRIRSLHG